MHTIHLASTHPINPSPSTSTHPPLTIPQIWTGLVLKCHKPQLFIPSISACEIVAEDAHGLKRIVTFAAGQGPPAGKTEEDITYYAPLKVRRSSPLPPFASLPAQVRVGQGKGPGKTGNVHGTVYIVGEGSADLGFEQAEFHMPATGARIANIVSRGPGVGASGDGDEGGSDLYLTFTFEWPFPELVAGSREAVEKERQLRAMGDEAVRHTIVVLREMAGRGEI